MSTKSPSKLRRYAFNVLIFSWVTGLHAAVVFAFEGTQLSTNQIDGSAIEINIGLHTDSMKKTPTNERVVNNALLPTPIPEPEPESVTEPEKVAATTPEFQSQQHAPLTKPTITTKATGVKETQASSGLTASSNTPSPAPRKVSRLEYRGVPPRPAYPSRALKGREQGLVVVRVVIDRLGNVSNAAVWQSSGSDALDQSALLAVQTTRFKPYQDNGVAREATADIPFNFVLKR
jgi:protein TonB